MTKVIDNLRFTVPGVGASASRVIADHIAGYQYNVKMFGALGNGSNDDTGAINACIAAAFTERNPLSLVNDTNSGAYSINDKFVYFPPGIYKTIAPIKPPLNRYGGMIYGAGMGVSVINNVTPGSVVFDTDGFMNSVMRDLSLRSAGGTGSVCYRWDSPTGDPIGTPNPGGSWCKENSWINVEFSGGNNGFESGLNGQCSETFFLNCLWKDCHEAGFACRGGNTLNHWIQGGRVENCGKSTDRCGIHGGAGYVPLIKGVMFVNNGIPGDITTGDIANYFTNPITVIGCYSTSQNFLNSNGSVYINTCTHTGTGGNFLFIFESAGRATTAVIENCASPGALLSSSGSLINKICLRNSPTVSTTSWVGLIGQNI